MHIESLMSTDVQTIESDASLQKAAQFMAQRDIGALPVMENGKIVGMVTDRDLVVRGVSQNYEPAKRVVRDVMSAETFAIPADQEVESAVNLMREKQVRRLLVHDADKNLKGIVTMGDLAVRGEDPSLTAQAAAAVSKP